MTHYIKKVTIHVNRVEVLNETYTSQEVDGEKGKGMVVYSYNVTASDGDAISVTAKCSVYGSVTETIKAGEDGGSKDDGKDDGKVDGKDDGKDDGENKTDDDTDDTGRDDPRDDDTTEDDTKEDISTKESGMESWVLYSIVGAAIAIIALAVVIGIMIKGNATKGQSKNDDWTTCPECGTDLMMKNLQEHLDRVHPELSKVEKEKRIP